MFWIATESINREEILAKYADPKAGALSLFEGIVRNHNEGFEVESLFYEIFHELALKEGQKIIEEAKNKFQIHQIICIHREGHLQVGETAIFIAAWASHRDAAFKASRYIIDQVKYRLPVWKKEVYTSKKSSWVNCHHQHHHVNIKSTDYYQKQNNILNQSLLLNSKVLIIGLGGLGCPASTSLTQAGIGELTLVDFDKIEVSNLHRQCLFDSTDLGESKVEIAQKKLSRINPLIKINTHHIRFDESSMDLLKGHDLVLDCTDNILSKKIIHNSCFKSKIALISASVYKNEGILRSFKPKSEYGCLDCFSTSMKAEKNCSDLGTLGVNVNMLGHLQAREAITYLQTNNNSSLKSTYLIDLENFEITKIQNAKRDGCLSCEGNSKSFEFEVSVHDLKQENYHLVDVRELDSEELKNICQSHSKIALYCSFGGYSLSLCESLRSEGFTNVYSLQGGEFSLPLA